MRGKILLGGLFIITSIILTGCGGGGETTASADSSTETGYFIDSAVIGVEYDTDSGATGTTDEYGRFQYKSGDTVRFHIGKLELGDAIPDIEGLVTPKYLANGDTDVETTLLRVLQALDSDNNLTNGITVSSSVVAALEDMPENVDIFSLQSDSEILALNTTLAEELDEDYDGVVDVSAQTAEEHFAQSMTAWRNDHNSNENVQNGHGYGNAQGGNNFYGNQDQNHTNSFDINNYPVSTLSQELKDALAHMGNEERLAYDVYTNLYNYYLDTGSSNIMQLKNIADRSEKTHVGIVQSLVQRYNLNADDLTNVETSLADNSVAFEDMPSGVYDIPAIQNLYNILFDKGVQSKQDALEVGCMVEVTDINDLDNYIALAEESNTTDVLEAFKVLRNGSYSHYWAFDKGLKNIGVASGCCSLGDVYCHSEYP